MATERDDRSYDSTICRRTGRPCRPGLALARRLTAAAEAARPFLADDFALTGRAEIGECGAPCPLLFRVTAERAWVMGGASETADADALVAFAEAFMEGDGAPIPAPETIPAAIVRGAAEGGSAAR